MDPHTATPHRVVILSPGGTFSTDLVDCLARRGLGVAALLLYPRREPRVQGPRQPLRWLARRAWAVASRGRLRVRARRVAPVRSTGPLNSARMAEDLRRLQPDWVVLAQCGLVTPELLSIPAGGTVNVHPGLLPWIRGNSPLANSLQRGVALGATAFHVDAGIDTGRIIERRLLPATGREPLAALRTALRALWVAMTADLVAAAVRGEVPTGVAQAGRFPLCGTLPDGLLREEQISHAGDLFQSWRGVEDLHYSPSFPVADG